MADKHHRLVQERIGEICHYRKILSRLVKHPVTLEQAIADWFERGYHVTPYPYDLEETSG